MSGHLQGFLGFLDLLAEGERRHAELVAGRRFEPALQPVPAAARVIKFPLTGHQKARLFETAAQPKVSPEH
ncbi:MAG TPA: hypothetical protein VD701_08295 [Steroidobacteraceae bacterium]|nr:hypothetical protein [Steroidobacteraceae bacterium]